MRDKRSSGRWHKIVNHWRTANLGDEPPEWLNEYVTATELTLADLHSPQTIVDHDAAAWALLTSAFEGAGAGPPPPTLQPHARAIIEAILDALPEDAP